MSANALVETIEAEDTAVALRLAGNGPQNLGILIMLTRSLNMTCPMLGIYAGIRSP